MTGLLIAMTFIQVKKSDLRGDVKDAVKEATELVKVEIKDSIQGHSAEPRSYDTGEFYDSVDSQVADEQGIVYAAAEHAKFLEFGTTKLDERPHFRNSLNRKQQEIINIFKSNIE